MSVGRIRLLLISGAGLLSVLLFIAPKIAPEGAASKKESLQAGESDATLSVYAGMAVKSLDPRQKSTHDSLIAAKSYDSLALFWDSRRRPDLGAYYFEQKAAESRSAAGWLMA